VPCKKEIHFYERETWICKFKIELNPENTSEAFNSSIICFSPDGKFVLATTSTQMVFIHSIINKSLVFKYSYTKKSKICSLAWNPLNKSEIIFCDTKGQMGQIKANFKDQTSETSQEKEAENLPMDDLLSLLDADEQSNDSTGSTIKKPSKKDMKSPLKKRKRLSDEDEDEESDLGRTSSNDKDSKSLSDDEDDMVSLEKLKEKTLNAVKKDIMAMDYEENGESDEMNGDNMSKKKELKQQQQVLSTFKQHVPFQSSSTPLTLPERYMVWNSVGLITQFNKEGDESIDIEFHNVSLHHTIHIKNQYGYTMGDMSKEAVVLASPGHKSTSSNEESEENEFEFVSATGANNSQSKLTCIMLNSCDNTKEWSIDMLRKENIRCVCVSKMFVVCATSRRFLRVYCLAGTQKEIICTAGAPICVAAYDNRIFVAHSNGPTLDYSIYFLGNLCFFNHHLNTIFLAVFPRHRHLGKVPVPAQAM
jgi:chromosome transmission fidelity protein 4